MPSYADYYSGRPMSYAPPTSQVTLNPMFRNPVQYSGGAPTASTMGQPMQPQYGMSPFASNQSYFDQSGGQPRPQQLQYPIPLQRWNLRAPQYGMGGPMAGQQVMMPAMGGVPMLASDRRRLMYSHAGDFQTAYGGPPVSLTPRRRRRRGREIGDVMPMPGYF